MKNDNFSDSCLFQLFTETVLTPGSGPNNETETVDEDSEYQLVRVSLRLINGVKVIVRLNFLTNVLDCACDGRLPACEVHSGH